MPETKTPPKKKKDPPEKKDAIVQHMPVPLINTMEDLHIFSQAVYKAGYWPGVKNPESAIVRIQAGRELGLQPIMALNKIHVTPQNDIIIATAVLGAIAMDKGVRWQILQKDARACKLRIYKLDGSIPEHTETFSWDDATRAGLTGKKNYQTYPEEMLFNRCLSKGLRVFDPRIGAGFYTKEEMEDAEGDRFNQGSEATYDVPEEGEVIEGEVVEEEEYQENMEKAMEDKPKKTLQEEAAEELNESPEVAAKKKEEIEILRSYLTVLKLDKPPTKGRSFKQWLFEKQNKKIFLRKNKFGHLSFHLGDAAAIHSLAEKRRDIVNQYIEEEMKNLDPGDRLGCFVVPERTDA